MTDSAFLTEIKSMLVGIKPTLLSSRLAQFSGDFVAPITTGPRWYPPCKIHLTKVIAFCSENPTVGVQVDVLKNGTSIFSGTYPQVTTGQIIGTEVTVSTVFDTTDYMTVELTSGQGKNLTVRIDYYRSNA